MVDCVTYERQNLDTNKADNLLRNYFGEEFESYDFNDSSATGAESYIIKKEDILNPTKDLYVAVKKAVRQLEWSGYKLGNRFQHYNNLLMILAAMTDCIVDSQMEEWEADPRLTLKTG